jgi:acyl-CoA thioester hydrolase
MVVESKIDVRYPDCDAMGIVHHAIYPYWYEIARMDFFAAIGYPYTYTHAYGVDPAMVSLELKYNAPVRYPGTVTVKTRAVFAAPKKLKLQYSVFLPDSEAPAATAESFHIWTGPDMRSYDMEQNLPEVYAALSGAVEAE